MESDYHKHIHCGEGGILLTNNASYANKLRLIRNHGEAVIQSSVSAELSNIIGYNFRLGEIEAAIATQQLKKLPNLLAEKKSVARKVSDGLRGLKGLTLPPSDHFDNHSFYILGMILDLQLLAYDRSWICESLKHEGIECVLEGYQAIHLNPIFQNKIAYGQYGFPWKGLETGASDVVYSEGICPVAEYYHQNSFIGIAICAYEYTDAEISLLIQAFHKVWSFL